MSEYDDQIEVVSNLYSNNDKDIYKYYNRFRVPVSDQFSSNIAYVFFTKPDLNLNEENISSSSYLTALNSTDYGQKILANLTCTSSYDKQSDIKNKNFLNILSNSVMNYETKDTTLRTSDYYENFIGYKLNLPSTIVESITADTVTFNFMEYDDLRITHIMKVWIEYINNIKRGIFKPTSANRTEKILDYTSSVYFFLCGPDGHSIKFFSKLTGVYPVNIPYSSFSWEMGASPEMKKLSVSFQYQIKEDLEPFILTDFNSVSDPTNLVNDDNILGYDYEESWANKCAIMTDGLFFAEV